MAQLVEVLRYKTEGRGFSCEMSRNQGTSTAWNPPGVYRDCFTFTITLNSLLPTVINTVRGQKVVFVTLSDGTHNCRRPVKC